MSVPTVSIGGVDRPYIKVNTANISRPLKGGQSGHFELFDRSQSYRPLIGQPIVLTDGGTTFYGTIDAIREVREDNLDVVRFQVDCLDYSSIFDHRFVWRIYPAGSLFSEIYADINQNFLDGEGFDVAHVDGFGAISDELSFPGWSVTACFNHLTDLSGEQWWTVDHSIYSKSLSNAPLAPFSITDTSQNWCDLEVSQSRVNYRNVQYVQTGINLASGSITDTATGNGTRFFFFTRFNLTSAPTVLINGVAQTIYEMGVDAYPADGWFWTKGGAGVQQGLQTPPGAGASIVIQYGSFSTNTVRAQDDTAISERAAVEGGSGKWEAVESATNITNLDVAEAFVAGLLRKLGSIPSIITYETDSAGLVPGMAQTVQLTANGIDTTLGVFGLYGSLWGQGVLGQGVLGAGGSDTPPAYYYVTQVDSRLLEAGFPGTGHYFRHKVTMSSVLDAGNWVSWWMNVFAKNPVLAAQQGQLALDGFTTTDGTPI